MESHYEVLGLSPTADEQEVRRAYRTLLKEHHPDQGGSRERFLRIKEAYEEIVGDRPADDPLLDGRSISSGDGPPPRPEAPTYDPDDREAIGADHETLTVTGENLTLTLSALVHDVSLDNLVDGHVPAVTDRTVAFFRVHNTSSHHLPWRGEANTSFIGDDGFLYEGSRIVAPHADRLPERWCGTDVEIPPGRALDAIVIAQEMPADVAVEKVLYTQHGPDAGDDTERYLFELRPLVRERLNRLPFRD
ncbi:J domain-containing protein [Haloterrigena alkaliphila]|uniref:J domain-containing protein n=1 Tax=Haloterrigena alkaliphila TaxID=2816475 RepID=A0A8A2VD12_9EURY|nr:J domain-containing protein [Haloterrigena alkaliphila]QSW98292.1 J domain-containing protein [Haloterrigena alkaliphila]